MSSHLLDCPCGKPLTVDSSLAGGQIACEACGKTVDVPSLRGLKSLPLADTPSNDAPQKKTATSRETNTVRNLGGIILLFSIGALILLIAFRLRAITGYTAEDAISFREQQIDSLNPVETWQLWGQMNEFGLGSRDQIGLPALEDRRVTVLYILMGIVSIVGAVGVVLLIKGGKRPPDDAPQ